MLHTRAQIPRFILASLIAAVIAAPTSSAVPRDLDVLYFPTPQTAVEKMLEMAEITSGDVVIDLGSGDGRIPITAAKVYGVTALGVDLDAELVAKASANAEREGVAHKVTFREQDLFETDLSTGTVITMFLLTSINEKLKPRLKQLKPGTRILSYSFGMGDWAPDKTERVDGRAIHMWVIRRDTNGVTAAD